MTKTIPDKNICRRCKKEFPFTAEYFYRDKYRKYGLDYTCKFCRRLGAKKRYEANPEKWKKYNSKYRKNNLEKTNQYKREWVRRNPDREKSAQLKYTYGITLKEYEELLEEQKGVCAICHNICSTGKNLCVDHKHSIGNIRGLLCDKCNRGLGAFDDNVELLKAAIKYLNK